MKNLIFLFLAICFTNACWAQKDSLTGSWSGELKVNSITLTLVFNFQRNDNGQILATFDSPDQGVKGIPVDEILIEDSVIWISSGNLQASYEGKFSTNKDSIYGFWNQSGFRLPLNLKHSDQAYRKNRPQDPQPPYSYEEKEIHFSSLEDSVILAGTLSIPNNQKTGTAIILVSGFGPQNRDEEFMSHRPFAVIADFFCKKGYMVLRYDDRGVGQSTGNFEEATLWESVNDLLGAINYLTSLPQFEINQIGLIGHSEGGLIAAETAISCSQIDFVVCLGTPALPGNEVISQQDRELALASGVPEDVFAQMQLIYDDLYQLAMTDKDITEIRKEVSDYLRIVSESDSIIAGRLSGAVKNAIIEKICSPNFLIYLKYDPGEILAKITSPILFLFGDLDLQVHSGNNRRALQSIMDNTDRANYSIEVFSGLNHMFQPAITGAPSEYNQIETTISPKVLDFIYSWILSQDGSK